MMQTIAKLAVAFVVLALFFRALEWTRPREQRQRFWRPGFPTDLAYWAFTPLATRWLTRLAVIAGVVPVAWMIYGRIDPVLIKNGFGPASQLPLWFQAICILILADCISYWMHRLFHRGRLWRFHAVHHSSVVVDWMAAVRVHPVNDALMRVASVLPVVALGFSPTAAAGLAPLLTLFAIFLHANVDWDFGPMRWVIASPRFHRWHHTSEVEGRDKNFAGLLPIWDILFGTFYMPRDRVPERFGVDFAMPNGLIGQLLFPFRRG